MITESFFIQGASHEVCEDYALHGANYAILSDGCSNGGGFSLQTDFGCRLLCKSAEHNLHIANTNMFLSAVIAMAATQRNCIPNLNPDCLTATLLTMQASDGVLKTVIAGDGVVGFKYRNGEFQIYEFSFPSNAPLYLTYTQNEKHLENYFNNFGNIAVQTSYFGSLDKLIIETNQIDINRDNLFFEMTRSTENLEYSFILSDGISSFTEKKETSTSKYTTPVEMIESLKVLLDFRAINPGFLNLQKNWAFKKNNSGTFLNKNWINSDDLSMGLIYFND